MVIGWIVKNSRFLVTCLCVFCVLPAWGDEHKALNLSGLEKLYLAKGSTHFAKEDSQHSGSIPSLERLQQLNWVEAATSTPNIGFTKDKYWFRVKLKNASQQRHWYFTLEYPMINAIDVYLERDKQLSHIYQAGDRFQFSARAIDHRYFVFPLDIEPDSNATLYVSVKSNSSIQFPGYVIEKTSFWREDTYQSLAQGMFFGILALMILYNAFLFVATRDVAYLYYVFFSSSMCFFQLAQQGYGYQYIWSGSIWWQHHLLPVSSCFAYLFGILFVRNFLDTKATIPNLDIVLRALLVIALIMMLINAVIDPFYSQLLNSLLGAFVSIFIFSIGVYSWLKGVKEARFLVLGWGIFNLSIVLLAGNKLGFFPRNFWTEYGSQLGMGIELTLLSFALADRINASRVKQQELLEASKRFESEAKLANGKALEIERIAKERLEKSVQSRTEQLKTALKELSLANRQLEEMNTIDNVTGARSLAFFGEKIVEEWDRAIRDKTDLSLILVSIDKLEWVGDSYGYVVAEEVLKNASRVICEYATRPADTVGRVASAEFGVLMPDTDLDGAKHVAKCIHDNISNVPLNLGVCRISVSASVSVVSREPSNCGTSEEILEVARELLLKVVQNGGGKIEVESREATSS